MAQTAVKAKPIKDFTQGPLLSRIILFSLPLIATSILQLLFNTADTIVVGQWGGDTADARESALAAVGSCSSLINLIINLFMGLSMGAGVCVAHAIGAKRYDEVDKVIHTSVVTAFFAGAAVTVFGMIAAEPLLRLMGTEDAVLSQAVPYMRAYFAGMIANMIYNYCAAILRSTGDTVRPLIFLSVAGVVNVALNLVMVLMFHQGAQGVGIATAASHWVSCILILIYMTRKEGVCHLDLRRLRIDLRVLRKILVIGLPAGFQSSLFAISNVLIQSSVNSLGKIVVAGNTASSNLEGYIYVTQNAVYNAALTFVGQNMGARKFDRIKKTAWYCLAVATAVGVAVSLLMFLFIEPLLGLYAPGNTAVIEKGLIRFSIIGLTHFICGIMEVGCGCVRGMGKSLAPTLVSLLGSCASRVVWIYTVFPLVPLDIRQETLYYCYPLSWAVTALAHFIVFFIVLKKEKQIYLQELQVHEEKRASKDAIPST
ncbi:MAG: MATE family efflux transporter [Clostridia bacterium]|nr:MATE family efflux transporter [Clostridia bacterium]